MALDFPASPTIGQVYQGWQWNGTSWDLLPAGALPTPAEVLLQTILATGAASIVFQLPAAYKRFKLRFDGITGTGILMLQISRDGGSTWLSTSTSYPYGVAFGTSVPSGGGSGGTGAGVNLPASNDLSGMTYNFGGDADLTDISKPNMSIFYRTNFWVGGGSAGVQFYTGAAKLIDNVAPSANAIRLTAATITAGTVSLYGVTQ